MVKQKLNWLNERDLSLLAAQEATQFIDPESYGSAESRDNARDHVEIGRSLAPLLAEDIMVLGSGNIVHNLGIIDWGLVGKGAVWAEEFDAEARQILTGENPSDIVSLLDHPHTHKAVPTAEHFLPIAYIAGIAEASGKSLDVLVGGCELGSLSMTSYVLS